MSLIDIPDYLLYIIMGYISDNKGSISLYSSCSYFKKLFNEYGYVKVLTNNPLKNNLYTLAVNSTKHKNTLNTISITHTQDPQYYIFYWSNTIFFNFCTTTSIINPTIITDTTIIYIYNDRHKNIRVNWSKFPKLERLELVNITINFIGIEVCKKLKNINMSQDISFINLPENLKYLITYK